MNPEATIPIAYLGMPGYGQLTAGSARGFWRASTSGKIGVKYQHICGSLLAQVFNGLWCQALTMQHQGGRVDYFAMQHADIEPEDGWLDKMIDELEANNLDIVGAVAPIKDPNGMTSIAIGEEGEVWRVKCRLSLKEIFKLPPTFTSEDIEGQLLLNTGLWVCRFDPKWNTQVHFEVNDRIVFDSVKDIYIAQVEPEDWYFSRLCHELNLKIGCTRKVALNHKGYSDYSNARPWGRDFDNVCLDKSILPERFTKGWQFPHEVQGWLSEEEGIALGKLSENKHVLEIGSYCGRSTICIAQSAMSVVSIDPHDGRKTPTPKSTYAEFTANLKRYGLENVRSSDGTDISDEQFDLIFIDGSHEYRDVKSDIDRSSEMLAPEGVIAFHDYRRDCDPGVTKAVDEFISAGAEIIAITDTLAVIRPPAAIPLEI